MALKRTRKVSRSRSLGGYKVYLRDAQRLTQTLVIAKNEGAVLYNRSAGGYAELIALEGGLPCIKEVAGIESAVPQEFIDASVEFIGARAGNCVDYTPGRASVLRGIRTA